MQPHKPAAAHPPRQAVIREAALPMDSERLLAVIHEYIAWLDMDLSYRGFDQEMAQFNELFTLPSGLFLMAKVDGEIAGCGGLLRHSASTAEVKRLYVRPAFRGQQLGQQLMSALMARARQLGFERLILDAVPQTVVAQTLYRAVGFQEIAPYYANPVAGTRFFGLSLVLPVATQNAATTISSHATSTRGSPAPTPGIFQARPVAGTSSATSR